MLNNKTYTILPIVDLEEVPDWQRRIPKWDQLVGEVINLPPGKSLPVLFPDEKSARQARNAVRDRANLMLKKPVIRTRMQKQDDGQVILHLLRLEDGEAE